MDDEPPQSWHTNSNHDHLHNSSTLRRSKEQIVVHSEQETVVFGKSKIARARSVDLSRRSFQPSIACSIDDPRILTFCLELAFSPPNPEWLMISEVR